MSIRVFLLDDHQVVREGLEVVGDSGSAVDALSVVELVHPDVAVLDVRLPDGDGVQVCREIRAARPEVACLMFSSFADDEALSQAVLAGASGYLLKQIQGNELVSSIRAVANGRSLIDAATARRVVDRLRRDHDHADDVDQLTDREREILALIADGKTNRQIGAELFLSEKTVKNYVSNLLAKLGMSRRSQAAAFAARVAQHRVDPGAWGS
jgi:two-component system response regulator DevR